MLLHKRMSGNAAHKRDTAAHMDYHYCHKRHDLPFMNLVALFMLS